LTGPADPDGTEDDRTRIVVAATPNRDGPPEQTRLVPGARAGTTAEPLPAAAPDDGLDAVVFWGEAIFRPGQLLANTFIVKTLISRGGMGEIYRATHRDLGTEHAIKVLRPAMLAEPSAVALLLEEARLLQHIRHDAVVACHGLIRDGDDRQLLVMEFVRGETLSIRLRQGALREAGLLVLLRRLLVALEALRGYGIVHQDISPDNLILRNDSVHETTLIDFGVARVLSEPAGAHGSLDFAGKYSWVSPEQLDPARSGTIGPASDLYSVALVVAAAARGTKLEMGQDLGTALAARIGVPALDGVAEPVAVLLRRLLVPDPGRRASAADLLAALDEPRGMRRLLRRWLPGQGHAAPGPESG
jgi:serine/threonine protein kinase